MALMDAKAFLDGLVRVLPYISYYLVAVVGIMLAVGFLPKSKKIGKFVLFGRAFTLGLVIFALGVTARLTCPLMMPMMGLDLSGPSLLIYLAEIVVYGLLAAFLIKMMLPFTWKNAILAGIVTGFATTLGLVLAGIFNS